MYIPKLYPHAPSVFRQTFIDEEMVIRLDRDVYRCCHFINCKITFAGSDPDKNSIHVTQLDRCQFDDCEITIIRLLVPNKARSLPYGKEWTPMEGVITISTIEGSHRNRPACKLSAEVMDKLNTTDGIHYQRYLMDIATKLSFRHITNPAPSPR